MMSLSIKQKGLGVPAQTAES